MGYAVRPARDGSVVSFQDRPWRQPHLISSVREAASLNLTQTTKICLLAQSTFNKTEYQKIVEIIKTKCADYTKLVILDTICRLSAQRQDEILQMAREVEAIIIIGARQSANTSRLAQIAHGTGVPTFHIQNEKGLPLKKISGYHLVGVTSGTSTPDWVIQHIVQYLTSRRDS
jgi:4-hydroxy-3-methylbut-2-enyl diphosphate reductase